MGVAIASAADDTAGSPPMSMPPVIRTSVLNFIRNLPGVVVENCQGAEDFPHHYISSPSQPNGYILRTLMRVTNEGDVSQRTPTRAGSHGPVRASICAARR